MFFGLNNKNFLKFFYNALLTGMPNLMNNPINKNILHTSFTIDETSTYINYKLDTNQINKINDFLNQNNNLNLLPSSLLNENSKDFYLSINIYNCTSPIFEFISKEPATRCELNIYVEDKDNKKGTLIMDYESNILSLDPTNLFKKGGNINFNEEKEIISGFVDSNNFKLDFNYNKNLNTNLFNKISSNLLKFTDRIYYPNGYYDKLYYDSSLIHNKIIEVTDNYDVKFNFFDIDFKDIDSIFYFEDKINFVGGLWENIYTLD